MNGKPLTAARLRAMTERTNRPISAEHARGCPRFSGGSARCTCGLDALAQAAFEHVPDLIAEVERLRDWLRQAMPLIGEAVTEENAGVFFALWEKMKAHLQEAGE